MPGPAASDDHPDDPGHQKAAATGMKRLLAVSLALLVALATIAAVPALRLRAVAAAVVLDALDAPVPRPFASDAEARARTVAGVRGEWRSPGPEAPPILLVPGGVPEGADDARVERLADALARAGRAVFVPDELQVYERRLVPQDVDDLVRITSALAEERASVMVLGISFGGSLGLLAAADDRLDDELAMVATFGAYADLVGVIQGGTTGTSLVDGQHLEWNADPRADEVIRQQVVDFMPSEHRDALAAALEGDRPAQELPNEVRAAYELLTNDDPHRTRALVDRVPDRLRQRLDEMSPISVADRIEVPVVAMHAADDPTIPYAELVRLEQAVPQTRGHTLDVFSHVDPELAGPSDWWGALGDLLVVWRFATEVLGAQR